MKKICTKCKQCKPLDLFSKKPSGKFGRQSHCKVCVSTQKLKDKYGITASSPLVQLRYSSNCEVCGIHASLATRRVLFIDHNHTTGNVRGLLCHNCNTLIGHAFDKPELLELAAQYLRSKDNDIQS